MHADTLNKELDCACSKLSFVVCGANNSVSQMRTYHKRSHAFESCLILNVQQLHQNLGYVPTCIT